jgi:hypothetical protein
LAALDRLVDRSLGAATAVTRVRTLEGVGATVPTAGMYTHVVVAVPTFPLRQRTTPDEDAALTALAQHLDRRAAQGAGAGALPLAGALLVLPTTGTPTAMLPRLIPPALRSFEYCVGLEQLLGALEI